MPIEAPTEELSKRLQNREWRLDNLYYILNKSGKKVKFSMNLAQKHLFSNLWYLNVILKARQLGFSTSIDIFILDYLLFNKNKQAGIIAHTLDDAKYLFESKIKFPSHDPMFPHAYHTHFRVLTLFCCLFLLVFALLAILVGCCMET